ncbi:hypothetical protein E2C01_041530 [Portunus trituberculatus]|uniref:Uncharacterized protein n=1 Tax=Portunus trituberculatus TaxID=210409 RepID=A0A5B7FRX4_PORTR|nr:hypothetical protein [Portunus trituberculatus]
MTPDPSGTIGHPPHNPTVNLHPQYSVGHKQGQYRSE